MTQLGSKKSRKGCVRCKGRRVKCNEEAPCSNCVRRGEQCSLVAVASPSSASETYGRAERDETLPGSQREWLQEMELMHHFSRHVSKVALGASDQIQSLWRDVIPEEALRHPFLLHGLLALSALSLASLRPAESARYLSLCDKHQSIALAQFRAALAGEITMDVAAALFALSSCISISSMARACARVAAQPPPKAVSLDEIVEMFVLTRGVRDVIGIAHDLIIQGPLAPMFAGHEMPEAQKSRVFLPPPAQTRLDELQTMLHQHCANELPNLTVCSEALRELKDIYRNCQYFHTTPGGVQSGHVVRYTTCVSPDFVSLMQNRYPPALIILAHWAVSTMVVKAAWYTTNWGVYAIEGISLVLEPGLRGWLDWPRQQMQNGMAAVLQGQNGTPAGTH
ncbi:Sterol uptake control protein 2-like protein 3 [Teratosphaeria destructans]|uniref:Sterol uptake control protein 2-like protein 3 n=1 Tax=Teratosphaeria destructans TaxID=418781 RepID=A0A9W7SSI9_9PEZI|nr:Sterol uptake control protein 2-like protein 3 [Teratosphaeria destructans]